MNLLFFSLFTLSTISAKKKSDEFPTTETPMTTYYYYYDTTLATTDIKTTQIKTKKPDIITKPPKTTTEPTEIKTTNKPIEPKPKTTKLTPNTPKLTTKQPIITKQAPKSPDFVPKPIPTKSDEIGSINTCDMTYPCTTDCKSLWNINYSKQSWYGTSNDINDESIIIKLNELKELDCGDGDMFETTATLAPWRRLYPKNGKCQTSCKVLTEFVNETITHDNKFYLTDSMDNFCGTKQSMSVDLCIQPCTQDTYQQTTTQQPWRRVRRLSSSSNSNSDSSSVQYKKQNKKNKKNKKKYVDSSSNSNNGYGDSSSDTNTNTNKISNPTTTVDIGYYYEYYVCDETKYEFSLIDFKDYPNVMTFKIGIDTWPFTQASNKLEICLDIKTLTNSNQFNYDTWDPTDTCINCDTSQNDLSFVKTLNFGNWRIDSPLIFWCDNKPVHNIDVTYGIKNKRKFEVCYTYSSCNGTLNYEALLLYIDKNNENSKHANVGFQFNKNGEILGIDKHKTNKNEIIKERNILIPIILVLSSIFIIIVLILIVLLFKKRKINDIKNGYESAQKIDDIDINVENDDVRNCEHNTNGVDIEESVEYGKNNENIELNEGNTQL